MDYPQFIEATHIVWCANTASWIDQAAAATGRSVDPSTVEATRLACWHEGRRYKAADLLGALAVNNLVCRQVAPFFASHDLLLTPTAAQPPLPLGLVNADDPALDVG